jgi:hypothetical protein
MVTEVATAKAATEVTAGLAAEVEHPMAAVIAGHAADTRLAGKKTCVSPVNILFVTHNLKKLINSSNINNSSNIVDLTIRGGIALPENLAEMRKKSTNLQKYHFNL